MSSHSFVAKAMAIGLLGASISTAALMGSSPESNEDTPALNDASIVTLWSSTSYIGEDNALMTDYYSMVSTSCIEGPGDEATPAPIVAPIAKPSETLTTMWRYDISQNNSSLLFIPNRRL